MRLNTSPHTLVGGGCSDPWANSGFHLVMNGKRRVSIDPTNNTADLSGGATWTRALHFLDDHGLSLPAIQSAPNFTVAGSIAANIHGRAIQTPMLKDQLQSMTVQLASGEIVDCSHAIQPDLFHALIGGMGAIAKILSARVALVPNDPYSIATDEVPMDGMPEVIPKVLAQETDPNLRMLHFMPHPGGQKAIIKTYRHRHPLAKPWAAEPEPIDLDRYQPATLRGDLGLHFLNALAHIPRFDGPRWHIARKCCYEVRNPPKLARKNNAFSSFSRPRLRSFRIAEYFVPVAGYCAFVAAVHRAQRKAGAPVLFAGSRVVYEQFPSRHNCLSYSHGMQRDAPWMSLVVNYCCSRKREHRLLRRHILPLLRDFGARFHLPYGMTNCLTREEFTEFFPQFDAWLATRKHYDPKGKFAPWVAGMLLR